MRRSGGGGMHVPVTGIRRVFTHDVDSRARLFLTFGWFLTIDDRRPFVHRDGCCHELSVQVPEVSAGSLR